MRRFHGFDTDSDRWKEFEFRDGDIVISSPMKAGTTWTQMICALLIFQTADLPAPLGLLSPWLDMQTRPLDEVLGDLDAQTHRRFIKTHTPLDCIAIPDGVTVVGVGRHPLDLARSAARHSANISFERALELVSDVIGEEETINLLVGRPVPEQDAIGRIRFFLEEDHPGDVALTLGGVLDHYRGYSTSEATVVRLHYSDLMIDREREMRRLAAALVIDVPEASWPALVDAAEFTAMKQRAEQLVPDAGLGLIVDAEAFFAVAGEGEWRDTVPEELADRFAERLRELDPGGEIADWAQHGLYSST